MSDLYNFKASRHRLLRAEKAVEDQQAFISTLGPSEMLNAAESFLLDLIELRSIAKKTHLLIMKVLLAKEQDSHVHHSHV